MTLASLALGAVLGPALVVAQEQPGAVGCDSAETVSALDTARAAAVGKRYELAARGFEQVLANCPQRRSVLLELAQAQLSRRAFPEAIDAARQYLATDSGSLPARLMLANAFFMDAK